MSDDTTPPSSTAPEPLAPAPSAPATPRPAPVASVQRVGAWPLALSIVALVASVLAATWAWTAQQRSRGTEQELVRRQQDSQQQATEARLSAQQTQEGLREATAKVSLLEARLAEVAVQRSQLEDLIQSLSRSRDENVVVDIDSALRVAQQQSSLSGSAEPLVAALRQSDERLARYNQPRLEGVRRAIARDLDRIRKLGVADIGSLVIKLDEAVRMVDELPLLVSANARIDPIRTVVPAAPAATRPASAAASAPSGAAARWWSDWLPTAAAQAVVASVWDEVKSLVRVTRINRPEAMLIAPEQSYFLRENLKLRLLNARLALLSRQFDTAQADMQVAVDVVERYHDRSSRRTQLALELMRQVAAQSRQVSLPRPDDSLAALAAAAAGR